MSNAKGITISSIPEMSAIYFALLQSGYDYYAMGRSLEHCNEIQTHIELIKTRFAQRMRGNLPAPVPSMLEKKHGCFDAEPHGIHIVSGETDLDAVVTQINVRR